jgi:hypothetical protein
MVIEAADAWHFFNVVGLVEQANQSALADELHSTLIG